MNVILDVDTGVDDAMALLLAARSPALNLLGVTCVMGNVELDKVVKNTLSVLEVAGASNVPVAAGMRRPLLETPHNAKGVHGDNGLGNIHLPEATRHLEPVHAVEFLRQTLLAVDTPITLIPLAPLTNIATLLTQYPDVRANIQQIVLMGGAFDVGNASAVAEFNVRQDPEAADIVFRSGLPITMYGLEVFRQITFNRSEAQSFANSAQPAAQLAGRLLLFLMDNFGRNEETIGDAGCVASVIDPTALTTEMHPVQVELNGTWTRGQTVVDRRPLTTRQKESQWQPPMDASISVAVDVNAESYRQIFRGAVLL